MQACVARSDQFETLINFSSVCMVEVGAAISGSPPPWAAVTVLSGPAHCLSGTSPHGSFMLVCYTHFDLIYLSPGARRMKHRIMTCCLGDRFSIMSNGDLHIRDVGSEDSHKPLRCTTYSTLTNDTRTSDEAMLYVIGNNLQSLTLLRCHNFIVNCRNRHLLYLLGYSFIVKKPIILYFFHCAFWSSCIAAI